MITSLMNGPILERQVFSLRHKLISSFIKSKIIPNEANFEITSSNVTIRFIEELKSDAIILEQNKYTLIILKPIKKIGFQYLEDNIGVHEFIFNSTYPPEPEFPIKFHGIYFVIVRTKTSQIIIRYSYGKMRIFQKYCKMIICI